MSDGCHGQTSERSRIPAFLRTSAEAGKLHDHARGGGRAARYRRARAEEARRSCRRDAGDRELHRAVRHHARRALLARADRRRGPHLRAHHGDQEGTHAAAVDHVQRQAVPVDQDASGRRARRAVRSIHVRRVGQALHRDAEGHRALRADDRPPRARNRCRLCRSAPRGTRDFARPGERRGVETRCLNLIAGTVHACPHPYVTPALAGAALAGAVHPHAPEKSHPGVLQTLTNTSRKSSPKAPGDPHQSLPNVLTDISRRPSPTRPGKAHQRLPQVLTGRSREGSPNAPVSAHHASPEKLTRGSRKVSPLR
ncbi:hypothetical protein EMIT0111MI5_20215 [Burkholderia sp. IT-111MI5]